MSGIPGPVACPEASWDPGAFGGVEGKPVGLVSAESGLSNDALRQIYKEHREGIAGLRARMEEPPARITDEGRWMLTKELGTDILALLPEDPGRVAETELILWVNATYDVMLTMIELFKSSLDIPTVPGARK
jgi:hypothetical protein